MTLAEYYHMHGTVTCKGTGFSATHHPTHPYMDVRVCVWHIQLLYQRGIPGRLAMAVCQPACSRVPSATIQIG